MEGGLKRGENKMEKNLKKLLKMAILLVSSLIIANVSAQVYNYLHLTATISSGALPINWDYGTNTNVTTTINGATCTISGMNGSAGATTVYNDTVRIVASSNTTFDLIIDDVSGNTSILDYMLIRLRDNATDTVKATIIVWDASNQPGTGQNELNIMANEQWEVEWEFKLASDAPAGETVTVTLRLRVAS